MTMREQLLHLTDSFGRARGLSRSRVSQLVLNRGSKLDDVASGGDVTTHIFERAMQWLSDNWPAGAAWPDSIPRPEPSAKEAAE
ncbi:MAG: hypothetical protein BGN85_08970 [Alphaproteobacteria bacterium 64-11]|nr:MAG: hypothetical protein BGN85_08970 [Alphaproteobacteria bacterium 64-11]